MKNFDNFIKKKPKKVLIQAHIDEGLKKKLDESRRDRELSWSEFITAMAEYFISIGEI